MTRSLDDEFPIHPFADPADFDRAREWFDEVGFTAGVLPRRLGIAGTAPPGDQEGRALERRLGREPVDELLRLFVLGQPLEGERVREALGPVPPGRWADAGVLLADGNRWQCPLRLIPFPGSDPGWGIADSCDHVRRPDFIMPPTLAALSLANYLVRSPAESALDLGAGAGFLSILSAGFAGKVTATDLCPRAVRMTEFNSMLNGRTNIEALEGSLYDPIEGRRFDRIVANLPFVLGPGSGLLYRDAGPVFDGIAWRAARRASAYLTEEGMAVMLIHWPLREGEDTGEVFGPALEDSGVDAWVLVAERVPVARYLHDYLTEIHFAQSAECVDETIRGLEYFRSQGVASIGMGMLVLRRRAGGGNWVHISEAPTYVGLCGKDIEEGMRIRELLREGLTDEVLLAARPVVDGGLRVIQEAEAKDGGWAPVSVRLRRTRGLAWEGNTDLFLAALAARCDGSRTGVELVSGLAQATGRSEDEVREPGLTALRTMLELGFIHL